MSVKRQTGTRNLGTPLAVVNKSKHVAPAEAQAMAAACTIQLRRHVAPAWARQAVVVAAAPAAGVLGADTGQVVLLDSPDQAGALGYHDVDPRGRAYARVFVEPVLDNGGDVLFKALSVASVVSHEVCEWFVDPDCQLWADGYGANGQVAVELCDPVEGDSYPVWVASQLSPVTVSNFVFPEWFNPNPPVGCRFDQMDTTHGPFVMSKGGYLIVRNLATGKVDQVFGTADSFVRQNPTHQPKGVPAARTAMRMA